MKSQTIIGIALVANLLGGCHLLQPKSHGPDAVSLPDDYTMTGTTVTDYQILEFPIQGRQLSVVIKKPGAVEFRALYKDSYASEYKITSGPPSDAFWFRKEVVKDGNVYRFPGPVAPVGTEYRIRSVRNVSEKGLY